MHDLKVHSRAIYISQDMEGTKYLPTKEWIKKLWYIYIDIYTMEYYSAIKMNEMLPSAETQMDLETVMQSEVSQKEKNKYCIISLICGI